MEIKATNRSAALTGIWTVFGIVPFETWMDDHKTISVFENNILWLAAISIFLIVPGYLFVIGNNNGRFDRLWFLDPEQRKRYGVITKRMFIWFFSAGIFGSVWSFILMLIWPR